MNKEKRLVVQYRDGFTNIPVTGIAEVNGIIFAYHDDELVGVFDLGYINALWISSKETEGK